MKIIFQLHLPRGGGVTHRSPQLIENNLLNEERIPQLKDTILLPQHGELRVVDRLWDYDNGLDMPPTGLLIILKP